MKVSTIVHLLTCDSDQWLCCALGGMVPDGFAPLVSLDTRSLQINTKWFSLITFILLRSIFLLIRAVSSWATLSRPQGSRQTEWLDEYENDVNYAMALPPDHISTEHLWVILNRYVKTLLSTTISKMLTSGKIFCKRSVNSSCTDPEMVCIRILWRLERQSWHNLSRRSKESLKIEKPRGSLAAKHRLET